ncbi:MAG TPA: rRNA maturation RNase YbeY [Candidatus Angelobacter sp.]|nr:rRNA maturation RNase YbeY [Candidatus Angelobacter sp.]
MIIVEKKLDGVAPAGLNRFVRRAQKLARVRGEVDVLLTGNRRLQELNRRFRRKNKPTDVLSFPRPAGGDIAISVDIAQQNAKRYGHAAGEEVKILILHGMLHLAGYDHELDNGRMAKAEARLRGALKLPASLIDRTQSTGSPVKKSAAHRTRGASVRIKSATVRRRSRP